MNSLNDELQTIFSFLNTEYIISVFKVNKFISNSTKKYIKHKFHKYKDIITVFKKSYLSFIKEIFDENNDTIDNVINNIKLSDDIFILYELIKLFRINYNNTNISVPDLKFFIQENNNKIRKMKVKTILMKYIGMGHFLNLYNLENTDKYFILHMGGSNGYEYDDNVKKLNNLTENKVNFITLDNAIKMMLNYDIDQIAMYGLWE